MAEEDKKPNLKDEKVIGNGSFGVVFQATMADTGETVAVKKVLQDKRFKVPAEAGPVLDASARAARCWRARRDSRRMYSVPNAAAGRSLPSSAGSCRYEARLVSVH